MRVLVFQDSPDIRSLLYAWQDAVASRTTILWTLAKEWFNTPQVWIDARNPHQAVLMDTEPT